MKKINKILVMIMCVVIVASFSSVFAYEPIDPSNPDTGNTGVKIEELTGYADNVFATVLFLVQVISIACVVFAGIRYMYASADVKADIKKGLMYLAIGAIFVFCASTVIKFIFNIGNSFIK